MVTGASLSPRTLSSAVTLASATSAREPSAGCAGVASFSPVVATRRGRFFVGSGELQRGETNDEDRRNGDDDIGEVTQSALSLQLSALARFRFAPQSSGCRRVLPIGFGREQCVYAPATSPRFYAFSLPLARTARPSRSRAERTSSSGISSSMSSRRLRSSALRGAGLR